MAKGHAAIIERLRAHALAYPEAVEEFPWGDRVAKVRGKIFVFLGREGDAHVSITAKLPESGAMALNLPFASPCGYGLGKAGWVSARFEAGESVPEAMLVEWIEESYRAVAPKRLVKGLGVEAAARVAKGVETKATRAKGAGRR